MGKWQAAYWGEKSLDVYRIDGEKRTELIYSGPPEKLLPRKGMQRRVLILGRSNVLRLRKQYPPAKIDKLMLAVEMEAPTLFPITDCSFHCRIAETYASHVVLDIWAWDSKPVEQLRKSFPFRFIIPEDLTFLSLPFGISIYTSGSMVHVLACGDGRFMEAASYPVADFSKADLERFLTGIAHNFPLIKEIRFYGNTFVDVPQPLVSCVKRLPENDCPPFLEAAAGISIKPFRQKAGISPWNINRTMLLRLAVYAVLSYGLMLFLTLNNYDKALTDLKNKTAAVERELNLLEHGGIAQDDQEAISDFEAKQKEIVSPLKIMNILASELPEGCHVKSLILNNGVLDTTVSVADPLLLIKRLSRSEKIGKVNLKGAPTKDGSTGAYTCVLSLEMKP